VKGRVRGGVADQTEQPQKSERAFTFKIETADGRECRNQHSNKIVLTPTSNTRLYRYSGPGTCSYLVQEVLYKYRYELVPIASTIMKSCMILPRVID
jgi:hypothetical protein